MKERQRGHLVTKVVVGAISLAVIIAVILTMIGSMAVRSTYLKMVEEELHATAVHLQDQLANEYDGDWSYSESSGLQKGGVDVAEVFEEEMDEMKAETGVDYTLFYGDTRVVTTLKKSDGSRLVGT